MNSSASKNKINSFGRHSFYVASISIFALLATFWFSNADHPYSTKISIFGCIIGFYLLFYAGIYIRQREQTVVSPLQTDFDLPFSSEIDGKLLALEEANRFFGASLKFADIFRLVASRTEELIPFSACALYLADEKKERLKLADAVGEHFKKFIGAEINSSQSFAGKTFQARAPQISNRVFQEENLAAVEFAENLNSAIAVPLSSGADVFGVFVLYGLRDDDFDHNSLKLFEAVCTRVAPLFLSSMAFESSLTNALTDALTDLPNERAFYLVLENQIAESQRFRDDRPLTILAMDIKNFTEINQRLGHATGDRLLLFVADKLKNQLRQMDFLARSINDEFLAVLPTASEKIAREIVERIEKTFVTNPFEASAQENIHLQLVFGAASFGKDGEAAGQLLQRAILRKQQSKSENKENKVLWFPKEYVN